MPTKKPAPKFPDRPGPPCTCGNPTFIKEDLIGVYAMCYNHAGQDGIPAFYKVDTKTGALRHPGSNELVTKENNQHGVHFQP